MNDSPTVACPTCHTEVVRCPYTDRNEGPCGVTVEQCLKIKGHTGYHEFEEYVLATAREPNAPRTPRKPRVGPGEHPW